MCCLPLNFTTFKENDAIRTCMHTCTFCMIEISIINQSKLKLENNNLKLNTKKERRKKIYKTLNQVFQRKIE